MSALIIGLVVFGCVFGGALLGVSFAHACLTIT